MTYDQLVTLDSIVKCGSFKAASEFLHKSQPSLSMAIKKLEEEFQIQIFDRSGYRPKLTDDGHVFYEKAKVALSHMKSLELFGEELGLGTESEIKVGIDGLAPLSQILCELRNFFDDFPGTNLSLSMEQISGTVEKVLSGELAMGFTPIHDEHEDLESVKIFKTSMIPVCSIELFQKQPTLEELKKYPQVIVQDSGERGSKSFGVVKEARKWNVSTMDSKKQIIKNALGWGRLPNFLIEQELENKSLLRIKEAGLIIHDIDIYLVRNRLLPKGPVSKLLWEKINKNMSLKYLS